MLTISKYCALCTNALTRDNDSSEHVLPNALGGRRTVRGFICGSCNNKTGHDWDAELVAALLPYSILLGIPRDRGTHPSVQFDFVPDPIATQHPLIDNSAAVAFAKDNPRGVAMHPDGRLVPAHSTYQSLDSDGTRTIRITCRSERELRRQIKTLRRKNPQLDNDDTLVNVRNERVHLHYLLGWTANVGGPIQGRAITKSVLALAVEAGVRPRDCEKSIEAFRENGKPCFFAFYDSDPIIDRVPGLPLHVVHVRGDPARAELIGYVELFGFFRFGVCLSTAYTGREFTSTYAMNPMSGNEIQLNVNLVCTSEQIRAMCDGGEFPLNGYLAAIAGVIPTLQRQMEQRELQRVIGDACKYAIEDLAIEDGEPVGPKDAEMIAKRVAERFAKAIEPYINHVFERKRLRQAPSRRDLA